MKAFKFVTFIAAVSILSVSACSVMDYHQGTYVSQQTFNTFQPNTTTLQQVRNQFGEPQKLRSEGKNTIYVYNGDTISANPLSKNKSETVVLTFNQSGILVNKERRENSSVSSNPLLSR